MPLCALALQVSTILLLLFLAVAHAEVKVGRTAFRHGAGVARKSGGNILGDCTGGACGGRDEKKGSGVAVTPAANAWYWDGKSQEEGPKNPGKVVAILLDYDGCGIVSLHGSSPARRA